MIGEVGQCQLAAIALLAVGVGEFKDAFFIEAEAAQTGYRATVGNRCTQGMARPAGHLRGQVEAARRTEIQQDALSRAIGGQGHAKRVETGQGTAVCAKGDLPGVQHHALGIHHLDFPTVLRRQLDFELDGKGMGGTGGVEYLNRVDLVRGLGGAAARQGADHLDLGGRLGWQGALRLDIHIQQIAGGIDTLDPMLSYRLDQETILVDDKLPGAGEENFILLVVQHEVARPGDSGVAVAAGLAGLPCLGAHLGAGDTCA